MNSAQATILQLTDSVPGEGGAGARFGPLGPPPTVARAGYEPPSGCVPSQPATLWGVSNEEYLASRWRRQAGPRQDSPVRVVIGQPDESIGSGVAALLGTMPGILVVGIASKKFDLFRQVARLRPDVVVSELMFGASDPCRGLQRAMRNLAGVPMVVLTAHRSDAALRYAVSSGACAFVERKEKPVVLEMAIRNAAASGSYFGLHTIGRLIRMAPHEPVVEAARLTERQTEIVALASEGMSTLEISARLGLRPKTIAAHMDRIRVKIGPGSLPVRQREQRPPARAQEPAAVG